MKYTQKQFTPELRANIQATEEKVKELLEKVVSGYRAVYAKKNLTLDAGFDIEGEDPFTPGYSSTISVGILDANGELFDLHMIKIWECERYFLSMPTTKNPPGSKVIGEMVDESFQDIKTELEEYLKEMLEDEQEE